MPTVQRFSVTDTVTLHCFQPPCGGSLFVISTRTKVMIDTGYGIYHDAVMTMLSHYGLCDEKTISRIIVTHADADHCGASRVLSRPGVHARRHAQHHRYQRPGLLGHGATMPALMNFTPR